MRRNAYGFSVESRLSIDAAEAETRRLLAEEGFAILTEIDVRETFKALLGVDFRDYRILGACDASIARRSLEVDPSVGLVLPCTVVLDSKPHPGTTISFLDPMVMLALVGNPSLREVAADAWARLMRVARQMTKRTRPEAA